MSPSNEQIDRLAWEIAEHGVTRCAEAVRRFTALARSAGVTGTSLDVLDDPTQPDVARARAFGRVAAELVATWHRHTTLGRPAAA
jgi:hypothetical protein